jgi:type III restriction enzyme
MIEDLDKDEFSVPNNLQNFKKEVADIVVKIHATNNIHLTNNDRADNVRETILTPNENFSKKEFQDLWNKIKAKTVYEVNFDSKELIDKSISAINNSLEVKKIVIKITT